jgi:hypothetical protein
MNACQYCVHDHAPADGYPGRCPFFGTAQAWKPVRHIPTIEEQNAAAMREVERQIAEENAEQRKVDERRQRQAALQAAKDRAARDEMMAWIRQAQTAALAEVHESIEVQTRARRLELKLARRADQGGSR